MGRVVAGATGRGMAVGLVVGEVGSGMDGQRRRLAKVLSDPAVTVIVVEHRERLTRFGAGPATGCPVCMPGSLTSVVCEHCGLVVDRDLNAAINLKHYVARSGRETRNGRGADQKTEPGSAGGYETSTPHHHGGQDGDRPLVTASCETRTQQSPLTRNG